MVFRRIINISWVDRVTNVEVLNIIGKEAVVMNNIKFRKLQYCGYILRRKKYQLLHLIISTISRKNLREEERGNPITSWLQNLRERFKYNTKELNAAKKQIPFSNNDFQPLIEEEHEEDEEKETVFVSYLTFEIIKLLTNAVADKI